MYTIDKLIEELEDARENMGGDTEIRVAFQPSWPLKATIRAVTVPEEEDNTPHCDEHITFISGCQPCKLTRESAEADGYNPDEEPEDKDRKFLWIAIDQVGSYDENPYAPRWAWG